MSETIEVDVTHELDRFYNGLQISLESFYNIRNIYNRKIAFDFNSLSNFFKPDENKISKILAFFLNPKENHAQGDVFLNLFFEKFIKDDASEIGYKISEATVNVEYVTNENRRIDIVIEIPTEEKMTFLIGVENKIYEWTQEQSNQLKDYINFLNDKTQGHFCLLYLTPKGHEASESSISAGAAKEFRNAKQLQEISYKDDIIELFEQFELVCQADNVRSFLKDFNHFLRQQYKGEKIMGEREVLMEYIERNPNIIKYQKSIADAIESLKKKWSEIFWEKLIKRFSSPADMPLKYLKWKNYDTLFLKDFINISVDNKSYEAHFMLEINYSQNVLKLGLCTHNFDNSEKEKIYLEVKKKPNHQQLTSLDSDSNSWWVLGAEIIYSDLFDQIMPNNISEEKIEKLAEAVAVKSNKFIKEIKDWWNS